MSNYDPFPPDPIPAGKTWGEETLIHNLHARGFSYFVQFSLKQNKNITHTKQAINWCKEQGWIRGKDYHWVGGRFYYEFVFRDEPKAMLFKLRFGH